MRNPVELVEDELLLFFGDTHPPVSHFHFFPSVMEHVSLDADGHLVWRILDGVVNEIVEHIRQMDTVGPYADTGIRLNRYIHVSGCFQPMIVHELFNHGQQFHLLEIELHVLPPLHAERENLFHQLGEQRQLFLADGEVLVQLFRIVSPAEVEQRVIDSISHGDRCLQFMGDVVRKVALHLVECPHAPDHIDKIGKTEN